MSSTRSHSSYQDAFARHGFLEGLPLWNPAPVSLPQNRQIDGLKIGDVGIIDRDGYFETIFNVCNPPEPALERKYGFPLNFTRMEQPTVIEYNSFPPGHIFSSPETSWFSIPKEGRRYTDPWTVNASHVTTTHTAYLSEDGSHILVPQGATSYKLDLQDHYLFESQANDNWATWFHFARDKLRGRLNTLHLVTGLCRTRSWALASFNKKDGREVEVTCELAKQDETLLVSASRWIPSGRFSSRIGPRTGRQDCDNQTVFIQTFTITSSGVMEPPNQEQLVLFSEPDVAQSNNSTDVGTTPHSHQADIIQDNDTSGASKSATGTASAHESSVTILHIPEATPPFHPSQIINRYLLMMRPSAEVAVTHDGMWIAMLARGQLGGIHDLESSIDAIVSKYYLIVLKNGIVYLRNKDVSLARCGVNRSELPIDLTHYIESESEEPFERRFFGNVYQGRLFMPHGTTVKVAIKVIHISNLTCYL